MDKLGALVGMGAGAAAIVLMLLPIPLPGIEQPLADAAPGSSTLRSWCAVGFALSCLAFAGLAHATGVRIAGWLLGASATGAAICGGPVVAAVMAAAVVASLFVALQPVVQLGAAYRELTPASPATTLRPRRLFA